MQLPSGFRHPVVGWTGNTIDVRTSEQLRQFLDDIFPPLQSPPNEAAVTAARAALAASHHCLAEGRLHEAFVHAAEATKLIPRTADVYAQQTRITMAANDPASGLEAAQAALRLMPESGELMLAAANFAYHIGRPTEAIQYCSRLRALARARDNEKAFGGYRHQSRQTGNPAHQTAA